MSQIHTIRINIGDLISDTYMLDATEFGAYVRLLLVHYKLGEQGLPDDDKELARYAGVSMKVWKRICPKVTQFFTWKDSFGKQKRVLEELLWVSKQRDNALKRHRPGEMWQAVGTCQTPARHKTVDIRHKTRKKKYIKKKIGLPDLKASEFYNSKAAEGWKPEQVDKQLEAFKDYCRSSQKGYADYPAAFRNCLRGEWFGGKPVIQEKGIFDE